MTNICSEAHTYTKNVYLHRKNLTNKGSSDHIDTKHLSNNFYNSVYVWDHKSLSLLCHHRKESVIFFAGPGCLLTKMSNFMNECFSYTCFCRVVVFSSSLLMNEMVLRAEKMCFLLEFPEIFYDETGEVTNKSHLYG